MTRRDGIVIVGAGQAGYQTAASLRQAGYDGPIRLIGDEPGYPYQRPPLSKAYLAEGGDAGMLAFRPDGFFTEQRIDCISSDRVQSIDRPARRVLLQSGLELAYDHLV